MEVKIVDVEVEISGILVGAGSVELSNPGADSSADTIGIVVVEDISIEDNVEEENVVVVDEVIAIVEGLLEADPV